jgi:hypothetical protein
MIDVKQAYLKIKKLPQRNILIGCVSARDKWGFMFGSKTIDPSFVKRVPSELRFIFCDPGAPYDVVNKKTGEISEIGGLENIDKFVKNSTPVDISIFDDL